MSTPSYSSKILAIAKNIDVSQLRWVLYVEKNSLPTCGGLYFVGTDLEPTAYIGQTECFKTRFLGHHRKSAFEQLLEEHGKENVKIRYWQAPPMPRYELVSFLPQLEAYFIKKSKTRFNNTANSLPKTPSPSIRRTHYGPIYVQLNQLSEYSVAQVVDGEAGFYFSVKKLSLAENAVKYKAPAFLISSGGWEDACIAYQEVKPEWKHYSTLYFLETRFRARWIKRVGRDGLEEFILRGDLATFRRVFLNDLPGFKEFSIRYLRTGLTNCSDSDFCETLLSLTNNSTKTSLG